jgi:hypothetical protein
MIVNLKEMMVSWKVLEVVSIEMVMVLRVMEQVKSEGRVAIKAMVEIWLVMVKKVQFELIMLVIKE